MFTNKWLILNVQNHKCHSIINSMYIDAPALYQEKAVSFKGLCSLYIIKIYAWNKAHDIFDLESDNQWQN